MLTLLQKQQMKALLLPPVTYKATYNIFQTVLHIVYFNKQICSYSVLSIQRITVYLKNKNEYPTSDKSQGNAVTHTHHHPLHIYRVLTHTKQK